MQIDQVFQESCSAEPIVVSAVVLWSAAGEMLLVRKRGTRRFMHPGGKPEAGESARQTAHREVFEELGLVLDDTELSEVGCFEVAAANEPGRALRATVFEYLKPIGAVAAQAELEELRWFDPSGPELEDLAPLVTAILSHGLAASPATRT